MRLSITRKIGFGFGAILLLMVANSLVVFERVAIMSNVRNRIITLRNPSMLGEKSLESDLNLAQKRTGDSILSASERSGRERARELLDEPWRKVDVDLAALDQLAPRWNLQENRDRLVMIKQDCRELRKEQEAAIEVAGSRRRDAMRRAARLFAITATPRNQKIRKTLQDMVDSQKVLLDKDEVELASAGSTLTWVIVLTTILGVIIGGCVAAFLGRSFYRATNAVLSRAKEIAEGDLTGSDVELKTSDEFADLAAVVNAMHANLRKTIESIAATTEHLASASEQISASATQQSAGTDVQKDQTQQVATAMQQMASTVLHISENSTKAAAAARQASDIAHQGGKTVEETLAKMRQIATSVSETAGQVEALGKRSDQIGQIIGVIDDIADQTNLLALNAAIEAARAGDQGRGFAVVADEVRKLAERTTEATKEIAGMIRSIQSETASAVQAMEAGTKQAEAGVVTTAAAGSSLREVIGSAESVREMIAQIATAATQQSSATEQVNANVEQIAKITAETALGAQQAAKACHDLSNLALDLQGIVSKFQLVHNGHSNGHVRKEVRRGLVKSQAGKDAAAEVHSLA